MHIRIGQDDQLRILISGNAASTKIVTSINGAVTQKVINLPVQQVLAKLSEHI